MIMLTPSNLRAGRAILKWSMRDLERESSVALTTIYALENDRRRTSPAEVTVSKILATFRAHGVEILVPPGDGARRIVLD